MEDLLHKMLSIDSTHERGVQACFELVEAEAKARGLSSHRDETSLIVGQGDLFAPEVGLLCHLDVVTPFFPPEREGDVIRARGAFDMKGPAVASFLAVCESGSANVAIAFTGDEETGGASAKALAGRFAPKALIVPDQSSGFRIVTDAPGVVQFTVELRGRAAHGSRPWEGENAIEGIFELHELLHGLLDVRNEDGGHNTLNLAYVRTPNDRINVVPDVAAATFDFRFVTHDVAFWSARIREAASQAHIVASAERVHIEPTPGLLRFQRIAQEVTGVEAPFVRNYGTCDARWFLGKAETLILTRPVGGNIHSPDEYVSYGSLVQLKEIIKKFIEEPQRNKS